MRALRSHLRWLKADVGDWENQLESRVELSKSMYRSGMLIGNMTSDIKQERTTHMTNVPALVSAMVRILAHMRAIAHLNSVLPQISNCRSKARTQFLWKFLVRPQCVTEALVS